MKRLVIWSLGLLFTFGCLQTAVAQQQTLEDGKQAFREERYADAAQIFERYADKNPDDAEVHYLLARVYFETPLRDEKKAGKELEKALELEPDNVLFMVAQLQQLRTESSNFFSEKIKEYKRSELAKKILERDPENAFAHEELGVSYIHDFWRYRNAIMLPVMQAHQGVQDYTNQALESDDRTTIGINDGVLLGAKEGVNFGSANDASRVFLADRFDIEALQEHGVPVLDLSARAQAAYERAIGHLSQALAVDPRRKGVYTDMMQIFSLKGEYAEALNMLQQMYQFFPEEPQLWTYLGLAHYELGNMEAADRSFETAFRYMEPFEQQAFRDLSYLLPQSDVDLYEQDPVLYASRYWTSKDPRYLTSYNERRLEHYARLTYADLLYGAPDINLRGWDTQRGRILVRYGQPQVDVVIMPQETGESRQTQDLILQAVTEPQDPENATGEQEEVDPSAAAIELTNARDLNAQGSRQSNFFEELNTYNIWEYGAFRFVFEDPFRNGEYRLYSPPASAMSAGADGWVNDYVIRARETFRKIPERYEYEAPGRQIELPYLTTAFKGEDGKADLYLHYGIPISGIDEQEEMLEITANTGMFLISNNHDLLVERRRTIYGLPTSHIVDFKDAKLWVDTQAMQAPPGDHEVSMEFETASGATVAVQRRGVLVPDFSEDRLAVSDLMLAYRIEEVFDDKALGANEIVRNGFSILPAPWSVYAVDQPIYAYYETYNLERDDSGKTDYDVELLLVPKEQAKGLRKLFKGLIGGEKGVSVSYHGSETLRNENLYQILDASDQETGLYTLILRVRDNIAGRTVETERDLFLEE
ncbi:MAG TPA: tetratricopeptide repeat protein [Rhodothermales bacterium]|nr:tetratricopeptide repeat protein [Rhodothermales bacterium]